MADRCGTCKHWRQWDTTTEFARDAGYCEAAGSYGYVSESSKFAASDPGGVMTHRTFGCVLHKPKTGEPMANGTNS